MWGAEDRREIVFLNTFDVERAGAALALHKGQDRVLVAISLPNVEAFLAASESFVGFDRSASAAHWGQLAVLHRLADAVGEEPSGFHAARQHPLNLIGRDAFLAGAHQVNDLKPKAQRKVRTLEDGSLPHSELPTAVIANVKAKASSLALHLTNSLRVGVAAVRANGTVRPELAFDIRKSGGFVIEAGVVESGLGHGGISYGHNHTLCGLLCQV